MVLPTIALSVKDSSLTYLSRQVFSIILSILTILTTLALAFFAFRPAVGRLTIIATFGWQVILVILWAAAAGTLGSHGNRARSTALRAAMALALIEMVTFLVGSVMNGLSLWRNRRQERKLTSTV